jgi:rhodanese-related sulfurtransferase
LDTWAGIDFFQVDNLIRGRVFFHIVNLGGNFDDLYPVSKFPMERIHLRNREISLGSALSPQAVVQELLGRGVQKEEPVVVFCSDGQVSALTAFALEQAGFKNSYFAKGGISKLVQDSQTSQIV